MQLLIVEDNVPDAELTVRQLRAAGIDCTWTRVATEDAFRDALRSAPDLIISDCTLPGFDGISAFSIAAAETPDIPFVFVSGTLGDERAREALKHGAAGYIAKGNREELAWTVRSALERGPARHRRASDRCPPSAGADPGTGSAQHLLARRRVLDETLHQRDSQAMTSIMVRRAPSPAALLVIEAQLTRDRFAKLLPMANLEIDTVQNVDEALERLADRVHAVLFTDNIDLIRRARQLPSGEATHIVFVSSGRLLQHADAIHAGANDCVPSDTRGELFWTHVTTARRIADFAASLQLAVRDRLCESIRSEAFADQFRDLSVTASFGVCALDKVPGSPGDLAQRLVRAADAALYESKLRGRDRVTAGHIADTEELVSRA